MNNLGDWIRYNANWAGDRVALDLDEMQYTYRDMQQEVDTRCHLLTEGLGLQPGDHIAYLGLNSCELLFLLFACARVQCSIMPLNNRLAIPEHQWILSHSDTRYLLVELRFD